MTCISKDIDEENRSCDRNGWQILLRLCIVSLGVRSEALRSKPTQLLCTLLSNMTANFNQRHVYIYWNDYEQRLSWDESYRRMVTRDFQAKPTYPSLLLLSVLSTARTELATITAPLGYSILRRTWRLGIAINSMIVGLDLWSWRRKGGRISYLVT